MIDLTTDSAKLRVISLLERHSQREVAALTGIPQSTISDFILQKTHQEWWKGFNAGDIEKETINEFSLADGNICYDKNGKFVVVGDEDHKGRTVILEEDDGSSFPFFKDVENGALACFYWHELLEVKEEEEDSASQDSPKSAEIKEESSEHLTEEVKEAAESFKSLIHDSLYTYPLCDDSVETTKITLTNNYGKTSIEVPGVDLSLDTVVHNLIKPMLLGAGYSRELVDQILGETY